MKIAVLSDIHSNSFALKAALDLIDTEGCDEVVILGDLLTYGCNVFETLELLIQLSEKKKTTFIKGNHDQIYFDFQAGKPFEYKPFPEFILESVKFTHSKLDRELASLFKWNEELIIDDLYFSHSNALDYGDWGYLNTVDEIKESIDIIASKNIFCGFFGHTHRAKLHYLKNNLLEEKLTLQSPILFDKNRFDCCIANSGSIGQSRGQVASMLFIDNSRSQLNFNFKDIVYNVDLHINSILNSNLSLNTKNKLIGYYK